jgi:group I intron endonuclease
MPKTEMSMRFDGQFLGGGIYAITHIPSGKRYIGATNDFKNRYKAHIKGLLEGEGQTPELQALYDLDGMDAFIFEVLDMVNDAIFLKEREQYWLDKRRKETGDDGLNRAGNSHYTTPARILAERRCIVKKKSELCPGDLLFQGSTSLKIHEIIRDEHGTITIMVWSDVTNKAYEYRHYAYSYLVSLPIQE